ncbi:MAG: PHP domain-containing protein, partial [Ruminococcus flavefaciens]|nr:PHP domain-containing protein [Ruminococcus flavefaciens]
LHTEDSLLDSCTNYKLYVDKAVELGQTAICFTEHGNIYNNIEKKMYANSKGLKYLHGVEIYLTASLDEKVRDNYHTILIAKNFDGVKEINLLIDKSTKEDHMYYKPRITFDEFFAISDNVIKISACLASPLSRYPSSINDVYERLDEIEKEKKDLLSSNEYRQEIIDRFKGWDSNQSPITYGNLDNFIKEEVNVMYAEEIKVLKHTEENAKEIYERLLKTYDYYEIQPHVKSLDQIKYNQMLYEASKKYGKSLIAGTDTHSINQYKAECRSILQKAKHIEFSNEDEFDLTYKSYDELVEMFRQQNSLPMDVVLEAIENTNRMADSVTDFELDTAFKYPVLYENEEEVFIDRIYRMYNEKLEKGIIQPNPKYEENIQEELRVFKKIGMIGFMLFMSELTCWCWDNDIPIGFCRGSVGGSTIAYLTDITDVDPVVWDTVFSRFANEDRKEIGDIDLDIAPSQRHLVYEHIIEKFGEDKTAYVLAIGTISDKGTIDEIGRALNIPLDEVKEIKALYSEYTDAISANTDKIKKIESVDGYENNEKLVKEKEECEEKVKYNEKLLKDLKEVRYKDLFYYFDGLVGTAISQSMHPAGIIVSPVTLPDNYGTFWVKDGKRILSINMEEIHEVSLVKYDLLGLKNIEIINDCCKLANIPYPKAHTVNWLDKNVWNHIADSPVGIFQFESKFAYDSMKKFCCKCVNDLSLVNASIRPSGESYRDRLLNREVNKNPSKLIDELLSANNGFLTFQEDTIKFLTNICGLSGSDSDNIRRAIGRKQKDRLEAALPSILEGYCSKSDKPREIAEQEAKEFLQIIEDSSNYQFGYNHSTGYSMIGYMCAFLRYHYPREFITAYLNNANNEDDIKLGTELAKQLGITIHSIKFRHSTAQYSCDDNGIYKGIASVKFLNEDAANDLYLIRDEKFDDFIDLLARITELKVDSRKLEILIKLDFFEEFGGITYLLSCNDLFSKYYGKKQMKKDKALEDKLDFDVIRQYSEKETQKTFMGLNSILLLKALVKNIPNEKTNLKNKIAYQIENLGYVDIVDKKYAGYCVALDLNIDYSPRLKLYALANGNTIPVKVSKKIYKDNPIRRGDIVKVEHQYKKPKMKMVDGEWVETDEKEWWISEYKIC